MKAENCTKYGQEEKKAAIIETAENKSKKSPAIRAMYLYALKRKLAKIEIKEKLNNK